MTTVIYTEIVDHNINLVEMNIPKNFFVLDIIKNKLNTSIIFARTKYFNNANRPQFLNEEEMLFDEL